MINVNILIVGIEKGITLEQALKLLVAAQAKIEEQELKIKAQAVSLREKDIKLQEAEIENTALKEKLAIQLRARFCAKSEKYNEKQPLLFDFEDENLIPYESEIEASVKDEGPFKEVIVKEYIRRKCGRKKLSDELPRKEIIIDIPEEEKVCACGARLVKVGEDRSERLQIIPAQIYVEVTVRPKYACRNCEGSSDEDKPVFRQMPAPKHIIQKSIATSGLLSFVFINKYCNHMPYYRQEKAFERRLIDISRADMDNWQLMVYKKLKPMEKILLRHIKKGKLLNMDETTVRVLHYDDAYRNLNRQKSYIWVGIGGPENQKACVYRYYESRNSDFIKLFINGFKGHIQTDDYPGYETALKEHQIEFPDDKITHIACMAHIRRRFNDALKCGEKRAATAMKFIQWMYRFENQIQKMNLNDIDKIAERKKKILPLMNGFYEWMTDLQPYVLPQLKFGEAISYGIKVMDFMKNYIECPDAYIDNTISERAVKPFVMSRKNFLFCGSEDGARSSCLLFSLIECAKLNSINPEDYLRCLFDAASDCVTESDFERLLPWNLKIDSAVPNGSWL